MTHPRFASALLALLASLPLFAATAEATVTNPMASVQRFVEGFNTGDTAMGLSACAPSTSIIDEFPPHTWASCADWAKAFAAMSKQQGISGGIVTLGKPTHVDITGSVAYVVVPATFTYKQNGKPVTESGSTWTLVLKMTPAGWKIVSWAWAAGK